MSTAAEHTAPEDDCLPRSLERLVRLLQALESSLTQEDIAAALSLPILPSELAHFRHFDPQTRCRNLIFRSDTFEVILIGWLPGQKSSLHEHGPSHCVFRVMEGTGQEERYHELSAHTAYQTLEHEAGELARVIPGEAHIVSNRSDIPLVTLHVYSPPLADAPPVRLPH